MAIFQDLLVIELATVLAGPLVGQFFAELGARVLKVEPLKGDVTRRWLAAEEKPVDKTSAYFSCCNWGKESIAIDLKQKEGQKIVHELIKKADIVITNYKPGSEKKLKMDFESIAQLNDQIIYAQVTGYGLSYPRVGYDAIIQAESGFMFLNRENNDSSPLKMPVALIDIIAAHQLKEGILVALYQKLKDKDFKALYIQVSLIESALTALANQATQVIWANMTSKPIGSDHPTIAPYGSVFKTRDNQHILLAIGNDEQFGAFCSILGQPEWANDLRFKHNLDRVQNRIQLKELIASFIKQWDSNKIIPLLHQHDVPVGIIYSVEDALANYNLEKLFFNELKNGISSIAFTGLSKAKDIKPPPPIGLNTSEILRHDLELSEQEISFLVQSNVVL